ncbi:MAG: hypothetical protein ACFB21_09365 [Opitutales bacterium]
MPSFENASEPQDAPPKQPARENAGEAEAQTDAVPGALRRPTSWASIAAHNRELNRGEYALAEAAETDEATADAEAHAALQASFAPTGEAETTPSEAAEPAPSDLGPAEATADDTETAENPLGETPAEASTPDTRPAAAELETAEVEANSNDAEASQPVEAPPEAAASEDQTETVAGGEDQPEASASTESAKAKLQRIDDSHLPDPQPSILQNLKPSAGLNRSGRLRRGRTKQTPAGQPAPGQPGEIADVASFEERVSGPLAKAKPEDLPPRKGRRRPVEAEAMEADVYEAEGVSAEQDDVVGDSRPSNAEDRPKRRRRRGGRGRRKGETAEAGPKSETPQSETETWSPTAAKTAEATKPAGLFGKLKAFFGKLFGGDKPATAGNEAPKAKKAAKTAKAGPKKGAQGKRGGQANRGPQGKGPRGTKPEGRKPADDAAETDSGDGQSGGAQGSKRRRRGKRGGRNRKPDNSTQTQS